MSFVLLGVFAVGSLNAVRAYISDNAHNKATIYGVLYGGVALFGALGALLSGVIWKHYDAQSALLFSFAGMCAVLLVYIYRFNNALK